MEKRWSWIWVVINIFHYIAILAESFQRSWISPPSHQYDTLMHWYPTAKVWKCSCIFSSVDRGSLLWTYRDTAHCGQACAIVWPGTNQTPRTKGLKAFDSVGHRCFAAPHSLFSNIWWFPEMEIPPWLVDFMENPNPKSGWFRGPAILGTLHAVGNAVHLRPESLALSRVLGWNPLRWMSRRLMWAADVTSSDSQASLLIKLRSLWYLAILNWQPPLKSKRGLEQATWTRVSIRVKGFVMHFFCPFFNMSKYVSDRVQDTTSGLEVSEFGGPTSATLRLHPTGTAWQIQLSTLLKAQHILGQDHRLLLL